MKMVPDSPRPNSLQCLRDEAMTFMRERSGFATWDNSYTMRELHGVISLTPHAVSVIKRHAFIFDRFHLTDLDRELSWTLKDEVAASLNADLAFLQDRKLITWLPHRKATLKQTKVETEAYMQYIASLSEDILNAVVAGSEDTAKPLHALTVINDLILRGLSAQLSQDNDYDTAPICQAELPDSLTQSVNSQASHTVIRVAMEAFPSPDVDCAWQDILDFKTETRDKQWGFRRFLKTLATKQQSESEIRDDIEWMIKEYSNAIALHRLKTSKTFFEAYIIPAVEVLEDFAKLNWAKLAKLGVSAKQRKIELLEAELKAPGRECAYVFEARRRFK